MEHVEQLRDAIEGAVLRPGDRGYDDARHVWNARFERAPEVIARCASAADVAGAVRWARRHGVRLSVKGGGHCYAGTTVADEGLLLDLSPMRRVEVDVAGASARVQAGATWADLDAATQQHGLATTGVTVSSVGVAGSTLGAGTGWLSRLHGNALDNLLAVDLVTVEGEQLRASPDEHPELFWGIRGAGHNLAVVTALEFRLHELGPQVLAGQLIHRFDEAERLLRGFREVMAEAPDAFQCLPFTFRVPPIDLFPADLHGEPVLDFVVLHTDPDATGTVDRLRELGEAEMDLVGPTPYVQAQQAFDPNLPAGARYYTKAHDLAALTDAAIDDFCRYVRDLRGELTAAYLEPRGGAVAAVEPTATAAGGREAPIAFHVIAGWTDPGDDDQVLAWARDFGDAMGQHGTGGVYVNLIAEDETDRIPTAFSDHERVRRLKTQWDPDNVLRSNQNVQPVTRMNGTAVSRR